MDKEKLRVKAEVLKEALRLLFRPKPEVERRLAQQNGNNHVQETEFSRPEHVSETEV